MRREPPREPSWPAFLLGCFLLLMGILLSLLAGCNGGATTEPNCGNPFNGCSQVDSTEVS